MKKKFLALMLSTLFLASCGAKQESTNKEEQKKMEETKKEEKKNEKVKKDIPEGTFSDMGKGEFYISTPGGTSENNNIPPILVKNESMIQIGINSREFDGSKISFIYIDGKFVEKYQLADTQDSIELKKNMLSKGKHKIEVFQFENDDMKGKIITYKSAEYEVK